jgi:hypothetical protein
MRGLVTLIGALASCVSRIDVTHVVLRDRTRVAVAMGSATVLPVGSDRVELQPGATLARGGYDGRAIYISSPSGGVYVAQSRHLDLLGSASELLSFDGNDVRVHWTSKHRDRRGRVWFAEPNIALDLITPRDNVASIDYERHVVERAYLSGVIATAVLAAGAASVVGLGIYERDMAPIAIGSVASVAFTALFALVLGDYAAHDIHQEVLP